MTKNSTLDSKLKALESNEVQTLAAIKSNRDQVDTLNKQFTQLEERRLALAGAKLIIQELQKEASTDEAEPITASGTGTDNVVPLNQN